MQILHNKKELIEKEKINRYLSKRVNYPLDIDKVLQRWETLIYEIEKGYNDYIYEYINDLTIRDIIDEIFNLELIHINNNLSTIVNILDLRFKKATKQVQNPISQGSSKKWWWYRIPLKLTDKLKVDISN